MKTKEFAGSNFSDVFLKFEGMVDSILTLFKKHRKSFSTMDVWNFLTDYTKTTAVAEVVKYRMKEDPTYKLDCGIYSPKSNKAVPSLIKTNARQEVRIPAAYTKPLGKPGSKVRVYKASNGYVVTPLNLSQDPSLSYLGIRTIDKSRNVRFTVSSGEYKLNMNKIQAGENWISLEKV